MLPFAVSGDLQTVFCRYVLLTVLDATERDVLGLSGEKLPAVVLCGCGPLWLASWASFMLLCWSLVLGARREAFCNLPVDCSLQLLPSHISSWVDASPLTVALAMMVVTGKRDVWDAGHRTKLHELGT